MSATTHLLAWLICQTCKFKLDPIYKLQNDELFNQLSSARRMFLTKTNDWGRATSP